MPLRTPDTLPLSVPLDRAHIEQLADTDALVDPEARVCLADHRGVQMALGMLTARQRQVLCASAGLGGLGEPLSRAEIADDLGISIETVSSTLTRGRNRLRAVGNILSVINGESTLARETDDNPLQTS